MLSNRLLPLVSLLVPAWLTLAACGSPQPRTQVVFPDELVAEKPRGAILFVVSAAQKQPLSDGTERATGTFLGEFYEPYLAVTLAGYRAVFATVDGATPAVDPESLKDKYWTNTADSEAAQGFVAQSREWQRPLSLADAQLQVNAFDGVIVPGGQGVTVDLLDDRHVQSLLRYFGEHDKPVGLVCHSPALLTRARTPHPLAARTLTSVSGFEEFYIETFVMGANPLHRDIGEQLEAAGYEHTTALPGGEHAVRDCNLVTSQNPFSTTRFSRLYLEALRDYRRGARCVRRGSAG